MTFIIYTLILMITLIISSLVNKKYLFGLNQVNFNLILAFLGLLILSLFLGLRAPTVGVDTFEYIKFYQAIDLIKFNNLFLIQYEPGFLMVSYLFNYFDFPVEFFLTFYAFFTFLFIFFFFRKNLNELPSLVYFLFSTGFVFFMMNGLRQALAISILIYSINFITNRSFLKFLFVILCASLFHYSAIFTIFLYFIPYLFKIKINIWLCIFLISIFVSPFTFLEFLISHITFLPKNYSNYIRTFSISDSKFTLGFFFHILISFLILFFSSKVKLNSEKKNMLIIYFIGVVFTNLTWQSEILQRFNIYFIFYQIPVISYLMISLDSKDIFYFKVLLIFLFLISFYYKLFVGDSGASPYSFSF